MADISEWSPVDESNTAAPPNGWPEFMAPSGINNAARAMMGAIRRWYDTVNAQLGGAGTINVQQLNSSGNITAAGTITATTVTAAGNISGNVITGNAINSNGNLGVAGTGNIAGDLGVAGTVFAHAFTDVDGAMSVFDVLRDLASRVEALENQRRA